MPPKTGEQKKDKRTEDKQMSESMKADGRESKELVREGTFHFMQLKERGKLGLLHQSEAGRWKRATETDNARVKYKYESVREKKKKRGSNYSYIPTMSFAN